MTFLRKDLGSAEVLVSDAHTVRLKPGRVWVDAVAFELLSKSVHDHDLEQAVALVQGGVLDGFNIDEEAFEVWVRQQRRRFEAAGTSALERYARMCDWTGKGGQAIATAERLLAVDPLREDYQRLALLFYARHRGRSEALAQAKAFTDLLRRELGVDPEAQTQALIAGIQQGGFSLPADAEPHPIASNVEAPRPSEDAGLREVEQEASVPPVAAISTPPHRLQPASWHPVRIAAYGLPVAALVLLGAITAPMLVRSPAPPRDNFPSAGADAPAATADPWRSPTVGVDTAALTARSNEPVIPIMVLPFGGDAEGGQGSVADQISDDLTNLLSRVYRFRVISRGTSRSYRGKPVDAAKLGEELGVRYVVEGSVRMQAERLRVNVELIDTTTRLPVWTDRIEHDKGDRHIVSDEIVSRISRELQVNTRGLEVRRAGERPTEVSQLVDNGWHVIFGPGPTGERLRKAEAFFAEALRKDPNSLEAQIGLAAYHVEVVAELEAADAASHVDKAFRLLEGVLARAPNSGNATYWLGRAYRHRGEFEAALRSFARAIELNPSDPTAHAQIGLTLLFSRRPADALGHIRYAMRLGPKDTSMPWLARFAAEAELELGNFAQAARYIERSIEILPNQLRGWGVMAAVHALAGNADAASKAISKVRQLGAGATDDELLQRIGRRARLGPNKLHDGLQAALAQPG